MDNNKKLLERAIELYCGKTVLSRIYELGEQALEPGFQESEFTMFGQDIKDFTDITKPVSMDDLVHLQSEYLDLMSENLINHSAKIDHYNGDFILAYWSFYIFIDSTFGEMHAEQNKQVFNYLLDL